MLSGGKVRLPAREQQLSVRMCEAYNRVGFAGRSSLTLAKWETVSGRSGVKGPAMYETRSPWPLAALASRVGSGRIQTFNVSVDESTYDESIYARRASPSNSAPNTTGSGLTK
jgi:hypothetical protein